jgi:hypothetical protein
VGFFSKNPLPFLKGLLAPQLTLLLEEKSFGWGGQALEKRSVRKVDLQLDGARGRAYPEPRLELLEWKSLSIGRAWLFDNRITFTPRYCAGPA